jgi:hypothetical protein
MSMNDDQAKYYQALGLATSAWAALEIVLNRSILIIFAHYGGASVDKAPPQGMKEIVKFLRKAFEKIEALSPFKEQGLLITQEVESLVTKRHTLIHGVALADAVLAGSALIQKFKFEKSSRKGHVSSETKITTAEIWDFSAEVSKLISKVSHLGIALKEPFPGNVFDYSIR